MSDRLTNEDRERIRVVLIEQGKRTLANGFDGHLTTMDVEKLLDEVEWLRSEFREQSIRAEIAEDALSGCGPMCSSPRYHRVILAQALEIPEKKDE